MEKEIRDMAETRTAHYLKYFCKHENTNINAESVKGPKYALITSGNLNAKSVVGPKYALITGKKITVRSAKGPKYAPITDKNITVRSAVTRLK